MPERDVSPPDYGTDVWAELPMPRSFAVLVFAPAANGTGRIIAFGPAELPWGENPDHDAAIDDALHELLARARAKAAEIGGVVCRVPVLSDYREV